MDAYCRILMLSQQLGRVNYLDATKSRELLELKDKWGFTDPRLTEEFKNCDICANDVFRETWAESGVERRAFDAPPAITTAAPSSNGAAPVATPASQGNIDEERLVKLITDQVMSMLKS